SAGARGGHDGLYIPARRDPDHRHRRPALWHAAARESVSRRDVHRLLWAELHHPFSDCRPVRSAGLLADDRFLAGMAAAEPGHAALGPAGALLVLSRTLRHDSQPSATGLASLLSIERLAG